MNNDSQTNEKPVAYDTDGNPLFAMSKKTPRLGQNILSGLNHPL